MPSRYLSPISAQNPNISTLPRPPIPSKSKLNIPKIDIQESFVSPGNAYTLSLGKNFHEIILNENYKSSVSKKPNVIRLSFRIFQFFTSLFYLVLAIIPLKVPDLDELDILHYYETCWIFLIVTSCFTMLISLFFMYDYYLRRVEYRVKFKRIYLISIDFIMSIFWFSGLLTLFINTKCEIGTLKGLCDLYNITLFFGFFNFVIYFGMFWWDIIGTFRQV